MFALYYGFDLPTEAEWEYSCRAGTETKYYTGNSESDLARAGWYWGNSDTGRSDYPWTYPVGQKEPNVWGLYDMHGNVKEWCNDLHGRYSSESVTNPTGVQDSTGGVLRGGSWAFGANLCRSAFRNTYAPLDTDITVGFRVVLRPGGVTY